MLAPLLLAACSAGGDIAVRTAPPRPLATPAGPAHFTDAEYVTTDGVRLPLRKWLPAGPVKAVVLALHGFGDYSHAFAMPAGLWAADGIATYAYDQRGFGGAPGSGLWAGKGRLARDAAVASLILRRTYPGQPLYLLGESMGGAVAILAASGWDGTPAAEAEGVVLSAPAVWGRKTMGFLPKVALFAGVRLFPEMVVTGRNLHILASDNLPMLRELGRDPLVQKAARVDMVYGLVDLMDDALAVAPRLQLPLLLMYGAHDEIVPPRAMADFAARLPPSRAGLDRLAYYGTGYHLLLRDLDGATVARDVANWIFDRAAPLPSRADGAGAGAPWPPQLAASAMPLASIEARR